jgi:O-antigen ligase
METIAFIFLLGSVFSSAFSHPTGRSLLALSLILLSVHLVRRRKMPVVNCTAWLGFAFVLVAVVVTLFSPYAEIGTRKLPKLLWFIGIPVCATLVMTRRRLSYLLGAYVLGTIVLAAKMAVCLPPKANALVETGQADDFLHGLELVGSMTDAQRFMVGILIVAGFLIVGRNRKKEAIVLWIVLLVQCVVLMLTFKRGSWLCTCGVAVLLVATRANWKHVAVLLVVVAGISLLPPVWARLAKVADEFRYRGGRWTMWTKVAPALMKEHPWGIGYRCLTNDMMRDKAPKIEANRNHLHSNVVQVVVDTGWLGLSVYLLWMLSAVKDAAVFLWRSRAGPEEAGAAVLLFVLLALLANGLVEYNFGDAEIVLVYGFIIGSAGAGLRRAGRVLKSCETNAGLSSPAA